MESNLIQQELFDVLKSRIPSTSSLADDIAGILSISADSAYRRIRGEKAVSIDELYKLCTYYKVSIDQLMSIQTDAFVFTGQFINYKTFRFDEYLANIGKYMSQMSSFEDKHFYYLCKDIPFAHIYHFREIAAFKYYFWMRTILHMPEFATKKVDLNEYPDELFQLGVKSLELYNQFDTYELWNLESLNSTIRQIDFYSDSQLFQSAEDAWLVYDAVDKLITHLEKQAEKGYKFKYGDEKMNHLGKFHFYFNELLLLDNTMYVEFNNRRIVYMVNSGVNFMSTRDIRFCNNMHDYIHNLMRKSTLLSSVNEKERLRFFNRLKEKIHGRKQALSRG